MANNILTVCCANCGSERITAKENGEAKFIMLPFGVPADAPLDNASIRKYGLQFAMKSAEALQGERQRRSPSSIITL